MNNRENNRTATGCTRRPVEIQAKEIPGERVTIMARHVLPAVRAAFEDPAIQAEYIAWLAARKTRAAAKAN